MVRCYLVVAAVWVGGAFAITTAAVIGHHIQVNPGGDLTIIDHPTGVAALWGVAQGLFFTVLVVSLLGAVIQMAVSYRRSAGERRQQLKWLASGAAVCLAGGVFTIVTSGSSGVLGIVDLDTVREDLAGVVQQALEPAHISVWMNQRG